MHTKSLFIFIFVHIFCTPLLAELPQHIEGLHGSPTAQGNSLDANNNSSEAGSALIQLFVYFFSGFLKPVADYVIIPVLTPFFPILVADYDSKIDTSIKNNFLLNHNFASVGITADQNLSGLHVAYSYDWLSINNKSFTEDNFNSLFTDFSLTISEVHNSKHLYRFLLSLRYITSDYRDSFALGLIFPYEYFFNRKISLHWRPAYYVYSSHSFVAEYSTGLNYYIDGRNKLEFYYDYKNLVNSTNDLDYFGVSYAHGF